MVFRFCTPKKAGGIRGECGAFDPAEGLLMEELRLTSWYGEFTIIYRVFLHPGWLLGISEPSTVAPENGAVWKRRWTEIGNHQFLGSSCLVQYVCWGLVRVGWLTVYQEIMKTTSHHGKMIFHFCHDASGRRRIVHSISYKSSDGLPSGFSFNSARRDPHNPCGSYHLFPRINLEEVWKKPSMLHRK